MFNFGILALGWILVWDGVWILVWDLRFGLGWVLFGFRFGFGGVFGLRLVLV